MSDAPPTRNPKRQRQKEGAQARRAAQMAALRRRQRNRRIIRVAVLAGIALAVILFFSIRGGDDDETATDTESTTTTSTTPTTIAPIAATPLTCDPPTGEQTDLDTKPTPVAPAEPVTDLTCQDLVVGDGDEVRNSNDTVTVHYVGVAQSNGEEFDASWGGDPATFPLTGVIAGWTEGIPGMKVGGRRLLTIPADKAYGEAGRPPTIGPNDTLVFIVDLLEVEPAG